MGEKTRGRGREWEGWGWKEARRRREEIANGRSEKKGTKEESKKRKRRPFTSDHERRDFKLYQTQKKNIHTKTQNFKHPGNKKKKLSDDTK